jgi:O-antigen/teichoic acid export membrane protein
MSGNEKRVVKVEIIMAAVMVVLSAALIPLWGIMGAAVASAVTNVGMNVGNLLQVRSALGLWPYTKGYLRLVPPTLAMMLATILLKTHSDIFRHDWLAVGATTVAAYAVFAAIVPIVGLDADDRLIGSATCSRAAPRRRSHDRDAAGAPF